MRAALAIATAAGVGLFAFSSASAQECVNGYRTLGNGVVSLCEEAGIAGGLPADYREEGQGTEAFAIEEPLVTGSIGTAAQPGTVPPEYREDAIGPEGLDEGPMVTGSIGGTAGSLPPEYREDTLAAEAGVQQPPALAMEAEGSWTCQPGQYWIVGGEGRDTPVFCR